LFRPGTMHVPAVGGALPWNFSGMTRGIPMDAARFDRWTQMLAAAASRRQTILSLLLSAAILSPKPEGAMAGTGCKNVGKKCKNAGQCCSGICQGKKGKKKCKAHDANGCKPGQQSAGCGGNDVTCTTSAGISDGVCQTTTGNAGFCTNVGGCFACTKDADCQPFCGPRAACIVCEEGCAPFGFSTSCVGPDICDFSK
jgi:hypothetical protein